jgi:hypothetical protein
MYGWHTGKNMDVLIACMVRMMNGVPVPNATLFSSVSIAQNNVLKMSLMRWL